MIVLDTDAVSELLRRAPAERFVQRLRRARADSLATTSITLGELAFGAVRASRPDLYVRAMALLKDVTILDFDRQAAEAYGPIRARLERDGTRLADPDLRIASIVLSRDAALVTGNARHFARVPGLKLKNWLR